MDKFGNVSRRNCEQTKAVADGMTSDPTGEQHAYMFQKPNLNIRPNFRTRTYRFVSIRPSGTTRCPRCSAPYVMATPTRAVCPPCGTVVMKNAATSQQEHARPATGCIRICPRCSRAVSVTSGIFREGRWHSCWCQRCRLGDNSVSNNGNVQLKSYLSC